MGHLLEIALALIALGASEASGPIGGEMPLLSAVTLVVPHLLARVARSLSLRGRFRLSSALVRVIALSPPALYFFALHVCGWRETASRMLGHDVSFYAWPELGLLVVGAPFVVLECLAIDARARAVVSTVAERRTWRAFQLRMLAASLVPVVAYVALAAAVGWSQELRVRIEQVRLYGAGFGAVALCAMVLGLPWLLSKTWDTKPIPAGDRRDLLQGVARLAGFRARALLVWNTGNMMANAAIVGIGGRNRVVLFSDALLDQLDPRELAAVYAHEIGHAFRRHVMLFAVWALALFLGADLLAHALFPDGDWSSAGVVAAALVLWAVSFSYISRRCELDADLFSMELLQDWTALASALDRVGGRLRDVASWRHFSVAERIRFLERASADPAVGGKLRRGLAWWRWTGTLLLAAVVGGHVLVMLQAYPAERTEVDLRLGRYTAASERARSVDDLDPRTRELALRAASLGSDEVEVGELERRARQALASGDATAAEEWLALGARRGRSDLALLEDALRAYRRADEPPEALLPPDLAAAWARELEALRARR